MTHIPKKEPKSMSVDINGLWHRNRQTRALVRVENGRVFLDTEGALRVNPDTVGALMKALSVAFAHAAVHRPDENPLRESHGVPDSIFAGLKTKPVYGLTLAILQGDFIETKAIQQRRTPRPHFARNMPDTFNEWAVGYYIEGVFDGWGHYTGGGATPEEAWHDCVKNTEEWMADRLRLANWNDEERAVLERLFDVFVVPALSEIRYLKEDAGA